MIFAGFKILAAEVYKIPVGVSLAVIVTILAVSIGASVWAERRRGAAAGSAPEAAAETAG